MLKRRFLLFMLIIVTVISAFLCTSFTSNKSEASTLHSAVYRNSRLGFSLTFPESWRGKYIVKTSNNGISVYFLSRKKSKDEGLFFTIIKKTKDLNESMYDSIGPVKHFVTKGKTYFIGGPTDVNLSESNPDFKTFIKMNSDREKIIDSIKKIK